MTRRSVRHTSILIPIVLLGIALLGSIATGKTKKHVPVAPTHSVLWAKPLDMGSRDLLLGPGGSAMAPDLRQVQLIEQEHKGTSLKYRIRDGSGKIWVAKIGKEAQAETAAVRLLWAAGYVTEINYLVPQLTIPGKGTYKNVRLEARPSEIKRMDRWKWTNNPFNGTREFQGLKVMMALINNWDLKDSNNQILQEKHPSTSLPEQQYIISDLGATFGKSGGFGPLWRFTRSRNKPGDYSDAKFIKAVKGNRVFFAFNKKNGGIFQDVSVSDARWLGDLLSGLSQKQISDAFRAANYNESDVRGLTHAVQRRINELERLQVELTRLR